MGAAIDEAALLDCIRDTLFTHLQDNIGEEETQITVLQGDGGTIVLDVNGFIFNLSVAPGSAPAPDGDS